MVGLLLIVLVVGAGLTALLWLGSWWAQGYLYTEPSPGLAWQAPAVGGAITLFLMGWCALNYVTPGASAMQVPYDAIHRAQSGEDYTKKPADKLWSYMKGKAKPTEYVISYQAGGKKWDYVIPPLGSDYLHILGEDVPKAGAPWGPQGVEAIEIPERNDPKQKIKFVRRDSEGPYPEFASPDGWVMKADNNIGLPSSGSWGRFFVIVLLNLVHLALWVAGLMFVLRYEWFHALGFGFVLWLVMTLSIVPMLLTMAGSAAEAQPATAWLAGVEAVWC